MDKDIAKMRKAEELEYATRLPLYSTMELFIETLTGTCFELRVSPYETVISVKAKIQRLEGIPISQQYLIWQNVELEDDYCLHDYNITDGCTLKLVLAMRGGPINTRRIAMEDPTFSEMADYIDSREEFLEKLSPPPSGGNGSKQVTLLVYRDGDQLNFFRVVDRGDGTLTPFSESLSGSTSNLREGYDDNEDEDSSSGSGVGKVRKSSSQQQLSVAQMVENNITAAKMKEIRSQMQNLHLNNSSNLKKKPRLTSNNKTPSLIKLDPKQSRPKSSKSKIKPEPEKVVSDALEKQSGDSLSKSVDLVKCKSPIGLHTETKDIEKASSSTDATQLPLKRAPLKRMNHVEHSEEISQELKLPVDDKFDSGDTKFDSVKDSTETLTNNKIPQVKSEVKQDETTENDTSGRFSPRTRRLLNALESSSVQRRVSYPTQSTAYRSPRSTMLQGMTFNRHDMYLRSYGLIASPDDVEEERVTSSTSGKNSPPVQAEDDAVSSKLLETSHGVKYSALPKTPYLRHGNRLLKSPPDWILSKDTVTQTEQTWQPQPPLGGGSLRNTERILRPPSTSRLTSKTFHQKPYLDSMIARTSKNFNLDKDNLSTDTSTPRQWQKLDSLRLPQPPPPSSTNLAPPTWQKQRLRRLSMIKPSNEENMEPVNSAFDNHSKDPLLNTRRSYGQTKSGLRMKESPHGKVESMSREEAREVVDFINKAVDASILRTLVRSPVKDGKRGSSGQNTHRLSGTNLQPLHPGTRAGTKLSSGPPILPPVKPVTKKKRCFLCAKRTGLASSYMCRCGNNFCATHRYAESHNCTYDYKSSGRKLLEEANPLISAPKLPKI